MEFLIILLVLGVPIVVISALVHSAKKYSSRSEKKDPRYETSYNPHSNNNGENYEKDDEPFDYDDEDQRPLYYQTAKTHTDSHSHPALSGSYKVEKNVYTENSMKGEEEQGCEELKDIRIISLDEEKEIKIPSSELKKMIIYNEILGKPRCKGN